MNFKVEDGTGLSDSTSYVDEVYADNYVYFYFPDNTEWASKTPSEKQLALVISTRFIDNLVKWRGEIYKSTQSLKWPRTEFEDDDGRTIEAGTIPRKVKDAVVEMALESLSSDIYDEGVLLTGQKYGSSSETYSGPTRDGGNAAARRLIKDFKAFGYGRSASTVTIARV